FCGTLRRYRPDGLSLVLTSYASHARRPRHVMVLKPSALPRFPTRLAGNAVPRTMGLLLGGQSGECRYDTDEWKQLLDFAEKSYHTLGIRWVVSNSRRTLQAVSEMVAARVAAGSRSITSFIDVRITGPGTLGHVLEQVQAVVCTDDSSTMISECVSAGLPVLGVRPRRAKFTPDEQSYRAYLIENGWHRSIPIAALTPDRLLNEMACIQPLTEDPLEHLATVIRERIPELFSAYPAQVTHSDQRASRRTESRSSRRTSTLSPA
ncbi:MAG TPA: ELM1/GtrOC1 family putative glycosyltransferase, partial [Hyphomicrobiaceae bacterium]